MAPGRHTIYYVKTIVLSLTVFHGLCGMAEVL